ncbi:OpgC domain-containing protein [Limibaculum sp. M0105]|uniref:OpgC domain-containing protein n=1 Tax=Thermohalobaculum xanthum TaxID=2753746 RepID=A0A8J7SFS2_9RHOB|nr:OpgC domain-containing protein [Thermohalobaculum xanthum]MBK0399717.1 OpgC domain-containing protein [Thermohalobaculum xanthum]
MIEGGMRQTGPSETPAPGGKRQRDLRLDFFRGLAMFIILLAHTPGNAWTLWIPARFGFSDATEIFVFCSGFASALAFGATFVKRSWLLGAARIAYRVWQVYWAHIGIFLVTATLVFSIDYFGVGIEGHRHVTEPYVVPLFSRTGEALIGLLTLTYVPGLFDILPMYLVILAMVPVVMALYAVGGRAAVAAFVVTVWLASNLAGLGRLAEESADPGALTTALAPLGTALGWMNLPSNPFGNGTWFFNPFGWQLVFFTGFAFGMGWIPAPPVTRGLVRLALAIVVLTIPFAWFKIHDGLYVPADWALREWIAATRDWAEPMWWKSWLGIFRYAHFLAVAYLAWVAVGPGGRRLTEGFSPPRALGGVWLALAAVVVVLTIPYAYVDEIRTISPTLDAFLVKTVPLIPGDRMGLVQLAHLVALIVVVWAAIGASGREAVARRWLPASVPVIRKVGTQSLAVFMTSIPLAQINGWLLGIMGPDVWTRAAINLSGFAILIATAYMVSWFKSQPWRGAQVASAGAIEGHGRKAGASGGKAARA